MRTAGGAFLLLAIAGASRSVSAHGGHASSSPGEDDDGMTYAEYHMKTEHHLDAFDLESFFKLHDLNQDGILDRSELEAIYGLHHETSREQSGGDEEHRRKSEEILSKVLATLDQNGDGVVTKTEFVAAGKSGLPEFSHHEGLGHHYDSEGEYFLHHEEIYHSTPETQTEESYTHPEDIAHFEHHEEIERVEEDRARVAQGLPPTNPDIPLDDQTAQPDHDEIEARILAKEQQQQVFGSPSNLNSDAIQGLGAQLDPNEQGISDDERMRRQRAASNREQANRLERQKQEAKSRGAWGENGEGFKKPKDKVDRLRDRIPYKYRVRSSFFGDF